MRPLSQHEVERGPMMQRRVAFLTILALVLLSLPSSITPLAEVRTALAFQDA